MHLETVKVVPRCYCADTSSYRCNSTSGYRYVFEYPQSQKFLNCFALAMKSRDRLAFSTSSYETINTPLPPKYTRVLYSINKPNPNFHLFHPTVKRSRRRIFHIPLKSLNGPDFGLLPIHMRFRVSQFLKLFLGQSCIWSKNRFALDTAQLGHP
jgi:hypothetical protein